MKRAESVFPAVLLLECGSVNMGLNLILGGNSVDVQSALPGIGESMSSDKTPLAANDFSRRRPKS
jgi:hypothetical protein